MMNKERTEHEPQSLYKTEMSADQPSLVQHLQKHYAIITHLDHNELLERLPSTSPCSQSANEDEEEDLDLEMDSFHTICGHSPVPVFALPLNNLLSELSLTVNKPTMRCLVCAQSRSSFFCDYCIKNGDFTSSKQHEVIKERFAEKKLKLCKLKKQFETINNRMEQRMKLQIQYNRLTQSLAQHNQNIQKLRLSLDTSTREMNEMVKEYKELNKRLPLIKNKNKKCLRKLISIKQDVENRNHTISERNARLNSLSERIRLSARERICQVAQYIFPIYEYLPEEHGEEEYLINSCETSPLLALSADSSGPYEKDDNYFKRENKRLANERLCIVEPWLPMDGDYSAYLIWAIQHKDLVPTSSILSENPFRNSTHRISSALSYATQLLSVIGFYLDRKFPRKLHFQEFQTRSDPNGRKTYLSEDEFTHKVAKLNANLFYFCVQQKVPLKHLIPTNTLNNLRMLTDSNFADIGHSDFVQFSTAAVRLADAHLGKDLALLVDEDEFDYSYNSDRDGNEDDLNDLEWESVPEMPYASDALTYSNTASVTTNIISSVVSMWRAATRK